MPSPETLRVTRYAGLIAAAALILATPSDAGAGAPAKMTRAPESLLNQIQLTEKAAERTGIEIGKVTRRSVPRTIEVGGTIMARPGSSAMLRAPVPATVEAPPGASGLPLPGTKVRAGQTILRLRPLVAPNRNLLAETQRDLQQAKARQDQSNKAKDRARRLLADGAGDQAGLELAEQNLMIAEAELTAAKERLQRARRDPLGADVSLPLRAPQDGVILNLVAANGQTIEQGAPLVEVVSAEDLWVRVPLYVGRIEAIDRAGAVRVRALGRNPIEASAQPVDAMPVPGPDGTVADLMYRLDGETRFNPGARVTVQLTLRGSGTPALVLPGSAIFYDSQGTGWVYAVIGEHLYERRRVDVRAMVGTEAVLARGPAEGTDVVAVGAMELFGTEFGIGK